MIATTTNTAPSFTAQCWITNGGSAIALDVSDPNAAPPVAARIITTPNYALAITVPIASGFFRCLLLSLFVADGTGATVRPWWYDDAQALWVPMAVAQAITYSGFNGYSQPVSYMPGARFTWQVTANTGVTKMACLIR
jgi:hypothetical protein